MLLQDERVFVLDIKSDDGSSSHNNNHNPHVAHSAAVSETVIHRRLIELFKCRDEFQYIDVCIRTSRGLSGSTRVDISNALAHMRSKGKKLRKLTADNIDYMDPSVHEFVVLNCLLFEHVSMMSNPLEQAYLSPGLAMSLRHALTLNKNCTKHLQLQCGLSESTSEILADAMTNAYDLETLEINLLAGRSSYLCGVLEGLQGKSKLRELSLKNVTAEVALSLATLLNHKNGCRLQELSLSYPWEGDDEEAETTATAAPYNTGCLCAALSEITNTSVTKLILDGIPFPVAVANMESEVDGDNTTIHVTSTMGGNTTALIQAFSKLETLSIAAPEMPHLDFLHSLSQEQLSQLHLKHCYFPCLTPNVEEARLLVQRVPSIVDIPDYYAHDEVVQHYLEWRKMSSSMPKQASVWPHLLARTNITMRNSTTMRQASMVYALLQEYHGMQKRDELVFNDDNESDSDDDESTKNGFMQETMGSKTNSSYYAEEEKKEDADLFGTFDAFDEQDESGDY